MTYQVLARKWRPQKFNQLVGQEHVSRSLCNALEHDRLHHAYLFTGTRGVGKTTVARILAKAINCENLIDFNPCGECDVCKAFEEGRFLDLIEVDAASRTKVEDTRDLLDNAQYTPHQGRYKVYLIDEVHMLSGHSFNALLKTLEEPPLHVKFLLATTDPQKIPVTVLSRCLQFNLKRLLPDQIAGQMEFILDQESINHELAALKVLSRAADGSMRDGLSLLDQAIAYGNGEVRSEIVMDMLGTVAQRPVDQILLALANNNAAELLQKIADVSELSPDFSDILQQIIRVLYRVTLAQTIAGFVDDEFDLDIIEQLANLLTPENTQLFYQIALVGQADLGLAPDPKMGFEMVMLRMLTFKPEQETPSSKVQTQEKPVSVTKSPENAQSNKSSTQSKESQQLNTGNDDNRWAEIVVALKIGAMTRELANNCVLETMDENSCCLLLNPGHMQLITPKAEEKLQQALREYVGNSLKLTIKTEQTMVNSPAQQITQQKEDRQQSAVDSINADENVQALKDKFGARIMPGTTEPI